MSFCLDSELVLLTMGNETFGYPQHDKVNANSFKLLYAWTFEYLVWQVKFMGISGNVRILSLLLQRRAFK